jgi:hypothetical protein
MRKLLATLIILLVVILLLPFGFGLHTQYLLNQLDGLRIPIKEGTLGAIEINVTDHHRGWFKSTATLNLSYEQPSTATLEPHGDTAEAQANALKFISSEVNITHGPILWRPGNTILEDFPPLFGQAWIAAPITYAAENFSSLEINGLQNTRAFALISLMGEQKVFVDTEELSAVNKQGQLSLSGLDLVIDRFDFGKNLATDFQIPQLNFIIYATNEEASGMHLQMDNMELEFDGAIKKIEELWFGTWLGTAIFTADVIKLDINGDHIAINNLSSASSQESKADSALLDGEGEVDIASVTFNDQSIGPIEMLFGYSNIDKNAVEYMRGVYNEWLYSDNNQTFLASLSPEQHDAFFAKLLEFVNYLPSYQIDELNVITPQGNFISDFAINIEAKAADIKELQATDYWKNNLHVSLDVLVSKLLMQQSMAWSLGQFYSWINPLVSSGSNATATTPSNAVDYNAEAANLLTQGMAFGIIKQADDEFASNIRYDKGVLTVNEKILLDLSTKQQ